MALTESEKKSDKKEKPLTKVIIRRLPPTMTKEEFLNQVAPISDYNYMYHVRGDKSMGENSFSRAYINFVCPEDVYAFKEKFDNYVFVDNRGHEYTAVVEFAPFQKIPKKRGKGKMDPKCNSIEADSYFLEFVTNLNKPIEQDEKPEYTLQLGERDEDKKDVTTPLLEFIKNKRAQRLKIREVRREEREKKKKEFERRKEHGSRYFDERPSPKVYGKKPHITKYTKPESPRDPTKNELSEDKPVKKQDNSADKPASEVRTKEKKPEEKREKKEFKLRFPKKEYSENREYYRPKHEEAKKDEGKASTKKIKKYSERREERKMEAQKAEQQKKLEEQHTEDHNQPPGESTLKSEEKPTTPVHAPESETASTQDDAVPQQDTEAQQKELDDKGEPGSSSRRIRNKDRPTIPLYRPGMLSKRKQPDSEESYKGEDNSEQKKD